MLGRPLDFRSKNRVLSEISGLLCSNQCCDQKLVFSNKNEEKLICWFL